MPDTARPEEVVIRLRPHARALLLPAVLLVAAAGLVPFLLPRLTEPWQQWLLVGGAGLLLVVGGLLPLLSWLGRSYTVTTRRVVLRGGVLVRTRQEVLHSRGNRITLRAAGPQLLFGSADVLIDAGAPLPVVLRDVPRAALVQSALVELAEAGRSPLGGGRYRTDEIL